MSIWWSVISSEVQQHSTQPCLLVDIMSQTWSCHLTCHQRWHWPTVLLVQERTLGSEWGHCTRHVQPVDHWLCATPDNCQHLQPRQHLQPLQYNSTGRPLTVCNTRQLPAPTTTPVQLNRSTVDCVQRQTTASTYNDASTTQPVDRRLCVTPDNCQHLQRRQYNSTGRPSTVCNARQLPAPTTTPVQLTSSCAASVEMLTATLQHTEQPLVVEQIAVHNVLGHNPTISHKSLAGINSSTLWQCWLGDRKGILPVSPSSIVQTFH